ncbi:MAG: hypothetical protein CM15mP49_14290 [Actinomycetota bacterium]|nr:MAG: hypothetical protein CM15mP49_14290 [Actinomycetota bacterium]
MQRFLVTEKISQEGLTICVTLDTRSMKTRPFSRKLMEEIAGAHAVIIRSATTITDEIMSKGETLLLLVEQESG